MTDTWVPVWLQGHSPLPLPKTWEELKQDIILQKGKALFLLVIMWELL